MRIGEVAERTGVSVRALRYYEEQGLLSSERSSSGQRLYAELAVDRVILIQQLYGAGLSSKSIVGLLPCVLAGVSTPESVLRLEGELQRIDQQIEALVETRARLDGVIERARASTVNV